jgi:single-strand DNA-binding protein
MEKLEQEGTIEKIFDTIKFDSGFQKREFIVNTGGDYPQQIKFEVVKDKCETLTQYNKVGDFVNVSFNLRGKEYTNPAGKVMYFTTLAAWKVQKVEADKHLGTEQVTSTVGGKVQDKAEVDDLPF